MTRTFFYLGSLVFAGCALYNGEVVSYWNLSALYLAVAALNRNS